MKHSQYEYEVYNKPVMFNAYSEWFYRIKTPDSHYDWLDGRKWYDTIEQANQAAIEHIGRLENGEP